MALKYRTVEVESRVDGHKTAAKIVECPECGCGEWIVYLIGPSESMHLQCRGCDATYCGHKGRCG